MGLKLGYGLFMVIIIGLLQTCYCIFRGSGLGLVWHRAGRWTSGYGEDCLECLGLRVFVFGALGLGLGFGRGVIYEVIDRSLYG